MKIQGKFNTFSNYISLLRLFLAVPFWFLLGNLEPGGWNWWPAGLALFAGVTDLMDGYLARKLNQVTEWGKILDPLADKVCMAAIALQLFIVGRIDTVLLAILLGRDIIILLASLLFAKKIKEVIPSNYVGKITVLVICFYVLGKMMYIDTTHPLLESVFYFSIIVLSVISLTVYAFRAIKMINKANA